MVPTFMELMGNLEDKTKVPKMKNRTSHQVIKN